MKYKENLMETLGHTNLDALLTQEEYEEPVTLYLGSTRKSSMLDGTPFFAS
jgi:hypothetical protein